MWPKANVEPRHYRRHLLNGCDSRFLAIRFCKVDPGETDQTDPGTACVAMDDDSTALNFTVIGSDQGFGVPTEMNKLLFEPGSRYDIIIDFNQTAGQHVIMANYGSDDPYGGDLSALPIEPTFTYTDCIMAFDVSGTSVVSKAPNYMAFDFYPDPDLNDTPPEGVRVRRVGLWEGRDEVSPFTEQEPVVVMVPLLTIPFRNDTVQPSSASPRCRRRSHRLPWR